MNTFEHQLAQAARQHKHTLNARLRVPANPRPRRLSAAWIASPVAAAFGLLIGLGIQLPRFDTPQSALAHVDTVVFHDTVYQTLRDTIRLYPPRHTDRKHYAHGTRVSANSTPAPADSTTKPDAQPLGRNIFEDGVDYSMLVSCIY